MRQLFDCEEDETSKIGHSFQNPNREGRESKSKSSAVSSSSRACSWSGGKDRGSLEKAGRASSLKWFMTMMETAREQCVTIPGQIR